MDGRLESTASVRYTSRGALPSERAYVYTQIMISVMTCSLFDSALSIRVCRSCVPESLIFVSLVSSTYCWYWQSGSTVSCFSPGHWVLLTIIVMALQSINSNVSRLTQRITENFKVSFELSFLSSHRSYLPFRLFQESTRDIPLFQGTANSSAAYFEYNHDKLKDISWLLEGGGDKSGAGATGVSAVTSGMRGDAARLEGMKRLIAVSCDGRSCYFVELWADETCWF
jgi:hypothetical protein